MAPLDSHRDVHIIDIRRAKLEDSLVKDLLNGLSPGEGHEKTLPTLLLYNEAGLKLFEKITYLDQYYLTNAEIDVLNCHADKIVERVPNGSLVVELGSGNLRKVNILLQAFERATKDVEYYALDLSLSELERTLSAVQSGTYSYVKCFGLYGTYDDGLAWLAKDINKAKIKCVLSLGSSIGNFRRDEVAKFLAGFAQVLKPSDLMLVGVDACQQKKRVFDAYNDRDGVTHAFYRNGLDHANSLLGKHAFNQEDWEIIGNYNEEEARHEAFFSPRKDVIIEGKTLRQGDMICLEESHKYSAAQTEVLWHASGLVPIMKYGNDTDDYHIHMMSVPKFSWPVSPERYAANPVPSLEDWEGLWKAWDTVTRGMVPQEELASKPIKLRNACIFYLGHIPTFLDIHITRASGLALVGPKYFPTIFERGIDPDVDNPELCHVHSEVPDTWPPLNEILDVQNHLRERVRELMRTGKVGTSRKLARAMWIGFEHEVMHLETFLYMLLQSDKTLPPPGTETPEFPQMASDAVKKAVKNEWFTIPSSEVAVGLDDPENDLGPDRYFGWDNEKPSRTVQVHSFSAQARPITNGEYAKYLKENNIDQIPASWVLQGGDSNGNVSLNGHVNGHTNGYSKDAGYEDEESIKATDSFLVGKFVRTVYGRVSLKHALDWPIFASYNELAGYATWKEARIPTAHEVKSLYAFVNQAKARDTENVLGKTISAVNGHLVNDGVEETPPSRRSVNGSSGEEPTPNPYDLFVDLDGCNVGFKNWHPTPITQNGNTLCGQGNTGGVWEWTSSPLEKYERFKPMDLYPGYTADFFDTKHNIVLGGSWATHPRVAGRKTFVNWYQRNYPFAWCGARLVRNI